MNLIDIMPKGFHDRLLLSQGIDHFRMISTTLYRPLQILPRRVLFRL